MNIQTFFCLIGCSLLCGAEELGISKPVCSEYGGGMKEFVFEDQDCFEGVLDEKRFLNSQERQSIVYHMLNNLRATEGEEVEGIKFLQGEPISELFFLFSISDNSLMACASCLLYFEGLLTLLLIE